MADDDDWMNEDISIAVPSAPEIPLPPLMAQSYVPGPASAGGAAAAPAAPKYRAIAVEFDDLHNQERSDLVVMMDAVSTSAKRTEPLRFATRPELREYPEFGEMVGARLAALRDAFGKEYVNVIIGILSEEQAGKGLNLKDLEKLSKMVNKVCLSVKKAAGRKQKAETKKGGKGGLHEGDELAFDDFDGGGDYDD